MKRRSAPLSPTFRFLLPALANYLVSKLLVDLIPALVRLQREHGIATDQAQLVGALVADDAGTALAPLPR